MNAWEWALTVAILTAPWALALIVALAKGYTVRIELTRDERR